MTLVILLTLVLTGITASSNIILKKGFVRISPFIAVYISVFFSTVLLWILTFLLVPSGYYSHYEGIAVFVLIGILTPAIVRTLAYYGIHTLGAGRAALLRGMTPFFATIMAIYFLKESPHPFVFVAMGCMITGIALIGKDGKESYSAFHSWRHILYPLGAAFLAGATANLRKFGLQLLPHPVFASAIASSSSLMVLSIYVLFQDQRISFKKILLRREMRFIFLAALLAALGEITHLSALLLGKVSLVTPILAATPLVVVLMSRIFLKELETVTKRLILATVLISMGVYLTIISA